MALVVWAMGTAAAVLAQPRITFESERLVAERLTPGGEVVWFVVGLESRRWSTRSWSAAGTAADPDGDGRVALEFDAPLPTTSVWAVVDLASGAFALEVPPAGLHRPLAACLPEVRAAHWRAFPGAGRRWSPGGRARPQRCPGPTQALPGATTSWMWRWRRPASTANKNRQKCWGWHRNVIALPDRTSHHLLANTSPHHLFRDLDIALLTNSRLRTLVA